ncbi:hypothetical protein ABXT66_07610 [Candidatus Levibacter sp. Uisw_134_01]|uniref:hypothetical protein n=1 Tax=Candidatus Levibacter sp. Uisw_134_01 TaxID=3230999 RepID=UPI003D377CBF
MFFKNLKIISLVLTNIIFSYSVSLASNNDDCRNSSYYVKNIKVDLTKKSIVEARKLAEDKAKLFGLKTLLNKLTLRNKKIKFKNLEVLQLVDYLKINSEANSNTRYVANFDICFNRKLIIEYFHKNKIQYAETYRKPISILPVFKGPRGVIIWDEKDPWYLKWKTAIKSSEGLVKFSLAKGNLKLSRRIRSNLINVSNKDLISKLINLEKSEELLVVIAEPVLKNDGKTFLSTYAKIYNKNGILENTLYRNKTPLKTTTSLYNIDQTLLNQEVLNIKNSIEKNWKKDNLINSSIINEVELIIPISSYKSTRLEAPFLFNDKIIKVKSTDGFLDEGVIEIEKEVIFYKKKNSKNFEHLKRGLLKSNSKIEYNVNTILIQKDITLWPFVLNTLKSLPFVKEVKVISISTLKGMVVVRFIGNKKTFFQAAKEKKMIFKDFNSQQYILNSKF